jgi:hypothetical protein
MDFSSLTAVSGQEPLVSTSGENALGAWKQGFPPRRGEKAV